MWLSHTHTIIFYTMLQAPTTPVLGNQACATPPTKRPTLNDVAQLTKLYELGIVTKEKVRQLVLQVCPDPVPAAVTPKVAPHNDRDSTPSDSTPHAVPAAVTPKVAHAVPAAVTPKVAPHNVAPRKRRRKHASRGEAPAESPESPAAESPAAAPFEATTPKTPTKNNNNNKKKKKQRLGRSSPKTTTLRKIAKDPTRRRFFQECLKVESILWRKFGGRKTEIDQVLFARAAKGPLDSMYAEHPGVLHSVKQHKLREIVKWQVCFVFVCCVFVYFISLACLVHKFVRSLNSFTKFVH